MVNEVSQSNNEEKIWEKYIVRGIDDSSIYKDFMVRDVTSQYYLCFGEYLFKKGEDNKAKKKCS